MTTIPLNAFENPGTLVRDLLRRAKYFDLAKAPIYYAEPISDPDFGAVTGIAITDVDVASGSWDYSTDNGTSWHSLDATTDAAARLLAVDDHTRVRFVPTPGFSGDITEGITFRAWDQTEGTNGGVLDATHYGASSSLSSEADVATITVSPAERLLTGLATIGDSIAGAYEFVPQRNTTRAWIEQIEISRGINLGRFRYEPWGDFRVPGREFMWGSAPPLSDTIVDGVSGQIAAGDVTLVHYAFGQLHLAGRYAAIYNGTLAGPELAQVIDDAITETTTALDAFDRAGDVKVILQNWGDAGQAPLFRQIFPDATRRQVVVDAINEANRRLQLLADERCIPLVDFMRIGLLLTDNERLFVGGVEIDEQTYQDFRPDPTHFLEDALHPGTVVMGLVANMFIEAANRAYGAGIAPLSEQEILVSAGITPPEVSSPTYYDVSDLVHFNHLPTATNDVAETLEHVPVTISVLDNDADPEGQPLGLGMLSQPSHGTVVANANGAITYTPNPGFHGRDEFYYEVGDGRDCFSRARVTVDVRQVVEIDVKAGEGNAINLTSRGVIPVALFGSATFDVSMVEINSVLFAGASVSHYAFSDSNDDGYLDLMLHFRLQSTDLRAAYSQLLADADANTDGALDQGISTRRSTTATLTGTLANGNKFLGMHEVELFFAGQSLRDHLADMILWGML